MQLIFMKVVLTESIRTARHFVSCEFLARNVQQKSLSTSTYNSFFIFCKGDFGLIYAVESLALSITIDYTSFGKN